MSECTHPQKRTLRNLTGFGEYCINCSALVKQNEAVSYTELQTAQDRIKELEGDIKDYRFINRVLEERLIAQNMYKSDEVLKLRGALREIVEYCTPIGETDIIDIATKALGDSNE